MKNVSKRCTGRSQSGEAPEPRVRVEVRSGGPLRDLAAGWDRVLDRLGNGGQVKASGRCLTDPIAGLVAIAEALEAGRSVPREFALWLAPALRAFLATEGSSLEGYLGLKPRPGGAFETVWQLQRRARRDRLLAELASVLEGPMWACSMRIAGLLATARAGQPIDASEIARALVARLLDECGNITPASGRQIARILNGECISKRRL